MLNPGETFENYGVKFEVITFEPVFRVKCLKVEPWAGNAQWHLHFKEFVEGREYLLYGPVTSLFQGTWNFEGGQPYFDGPTPWMSLCGDGTILIH
jgi:hypothetical protein